MLNLFQHLLQMRRLRVILNQVQDAMTGVSQVTFLEVPSMSNASTARRRQKPAPSYKMGIAYSEQFA